MLLAGTKLRSPPSLFSGLPWVSFPLGTLFYRKLVPLLQGPRRQGPVAEREPSKCADALLQALRKHPKVVGKLTSNDTNSTGASSWRSLQVYCNRALL